MNDSFNSIGGGRRGRPDPTKGALSLGRRRLVELMHRINFGCIEQPNVRGGQPVFEPPPRIVREHKFVGENGPRDERAVADFALKAQIVELFDEIDRLHEGVIDLLMVKHGLPFCMHVNLAGGARQASA